MITTIYKVTAKRRKGADKGRTTTREHAYRTKTLTIMHRRLREVYGGKTYEGGKYYSHFCEGLPMPMVLGGREIK